MCGIFGFVAKNNSGLSPVKIESILNSLFKLSEVRGKETAGIAISSGGEIEYAKMPISASMLIKTPEYKSSMNRMLKNTDSVNGSLTESITVIGHTGLMINGYQGAYENNQPVDSNNVLGVHDGIIVNDEEIWGTHSSLLRNCDVSTEVILALVRKFYDENKSFVQSIIKAYSIIEGSASIALIPKEVNKLILATNTGSLYICEDEFNRFSIFASELYILKKLVKQYGNDSIFERCTITHLKPSNGCIIDVGNLGKEGFSFNGIKKISLPKRKTGNTIIIPKNSLNEKYVEDINSIKRCTKCILPETFPHIEFDQDGVCNYCRSYKKVELHGENALKQAVEKYRKKTGEQDCIVAFSGGRDSCYGLHYIKEVLGMNPVAYTYDWGMVTDIARRNAARICGKLGIEHIIVSADIAKKRDYVRKNVLAWLKRPDLGMIPLFMAGDKQFYYYANKLRQQTNIDLIMFSAGNSLETTNFKTGFCGVTQYSDNGVLDKLKLANKAKLALYYGKQYMLNPGYINSSIIDTLFAFASSYIINHNYIYLYHYLSWDEKNIMELLVDKYGWEIDPNTKVVWRIGDGTAAFYNYIYYTVAGFTENDTFRSNQIREGMISREEALRKVQSENIPRYDAIKTYCELIGVEFEDTLRSINLIPKLYEMKRS